MILAKYWCAVTDTLTTNSNSINSTMDLNHVFANHNDKEEINPLTVSEIAETKDKGLQHKDVLVSLRKLLLKIHMCSVKMVKW